MSRIKTMLRALVLVLMAPSAGIAGQTTDLATTFATCTGRLSALMEHQWLMGAPEADETERRRATMETLLVSVLAPGEGRAALAKRIEAKFALAKLLNTLTFGDDPKRTAWARNRVATDIGACNALLLG
ncbi:hypothetical protein ACXYMO_12005 [Arenibacterium sp. CAU 1754]